MNVETKASKTVTRREAFKWVGKRVLETALFTSAVEIGSHLKTATEGIDKPLQVALDNFQKRESGAVPLETKYYSFDILTVAAERDFPTPDPDIAITIAKESAEFGMGGLIGNTAIAYALKDQSVDLNRFAGATSGIVARTIDDISTNVGIKTDEDPRFKEYGFIDYYFLGETNVALSNFPTEEELFLVSLVQLAPLVVSSWFLPFIGRNYLGNIPFIVSRNLGVASFIKDAYSVGDEVKGMIQKGANNDFITNYLKTLAEQAKQLKSTQ